MIDPVHGPVAVAATRTVALPFAGTDTWLVASVMVKSALSLKPTFTVKRTSRPFGFLTSTVVYGSSWLAQCTSTAVPSFRDRAVPEEVVVGVER